MRVAQRRLVFAAAAALSAAASGCVDTDAAVFVEASIASPSAAVSQETLGASLAGSFALELHLGPRASGASRVSLLAFEIASADQMTTIVPSLPVTTASALPVEVAPDSDVTVQLSFDTQGGGDVLPSDVVEPLCAAEGVRVRGSIQDSLEDGATPVVSDVFRPNCM